MQAARGYVISIDTGGTFTDGVFIGPESVRMAKVDTTPHDLSVCLLNCIDEGAAAHGLTTAQLLGATEIVIYGTTITTNTIVTRTGSRVGAIVAKGFEGNFYRDERYQGERIEDTLLSREMVVGIGSELSEDEIKVAVRRLLDLGSDVIAICLGGPQAREGGESEVRRVIYGEYPRFYIASPTVMISSEVSFLGSDAERLNTVIVDAYIHKVISKYLYRAEDEIRKRGYKRHLLIANSSGGLSRVAKTAALSTFEGGPAAGVIGSKELARLYGLDQVLVAETGGTTTNFATVHASGHLYDLRPKVEGFPIGSLVIGAQSIGAGGCSLAWLSNGELEVGPMSAGALPGPACYDLGGSEPTICDANLILNIFTPDTILGGRRKLVKEKAVKAIKEKVADPLGIAVEEAAWASRRVLEEKIASRLKDFIDNKAKSVTLFSYGGEGPCHAAFYAEELAIGKVMAFPFGGHYCALGAVLMNVAHCYDSKTSLSLGSDDSSNAELLRDIFHRLRKRAQSDMEGEGLDPARIVYNLELGVSGMRGPLSTVIPVNPQSLQDGFGKIRSAIEKASPDGNQEISLVRVSASVPTNLYDLPEYARTGSNPSGALKETRDVYLEEGWKPTKVYELKRLKCGNVVEGNAVLESESTTIVVPEGWRSAIDSRYNIVMERI